MTFGNDDRHLFGAESCSGGGTFTPGTGNIDVDPQFVDAAAGDFHLLWSSPAIDAGGSTCGAPCQGSDLDGLTRPIDGDGDGVATRDMGAYEYGRRPPTVHASVSATAATAGQPVTFTATPADPDDGDVLSVTWQFDDGTSATGASVSHAFATPGAHSATVTVEDPMGLSATAASNTVSVVAAPPASTTTSTSTTTTPAPQPKPSARDTTPPTVRSLRISPATFAVAPGRTATLAATTRAHRPHHKGTMIAFTLSERARVVIAFARRRTGIRVGKRCQAPSRKHRHGRACTRYAAAGALTRRSEPAGKLGIPFTGRLGRAAIRLGRYRLTLTATDPAGNRSAPKTAVFTVVTR
jgi:PKD repeat protein